ncbi:MAG: hypothetical protein ACR2P3_13200 [Geminicoccaceae bacterium]
MTYLATEMLLYLLSAATIGLALGWLVRGGGRRRKLDALRRDLTTKIEAEKADHRETRLALDGADARMKRAVEDAKAETGGSLAELQRTLDAERLAALETRTAFEQMRADMDAALHEGRASGQEAVDQVMRTANEERAAAAEAIAKEAQSRAQIEELRLLIGAEKLAAESARAELLRARSDMKAELEAERAHHRQAKIALDDIRSTLARTFSPEAIDAVANAGKASAAPRASHNASPLVAPETDHLEETSDQQGGLQNPAATKSTPSPLGAMAEMAAAGEALNNPDLHEADIEDREDLSLDLSSTIEPEWEEVEAIEAVDPKPLSDRIKLAPSSMASVNDETPTVLLDRRPDKGDDLKAIDGISPDLERRLQEQGFRHYRQLANLTPEEIDGLARSIDVTADQIDADCWVEQAKSLQLEASTVIDDDPTLMASTDLKNAAS